MSENESKRNSRRKFLKAGAVAGGAAVIGLSVGLPQVLNSQNLVKATDTYTTQISGTNCDDNSGYGYNNYGGYTPKERWYFLYATDGISLVPTDRFGLTHRPVYMYGFATPMSWNKPYGYAKGNVGTPGVGPPGLADLRSAFADVNWIDPNTQQPIMRGKAMMPGPPIWGIEGDILDISLFNIGFAFGSCVTDPHTIHLHGVHAPNYYDGIPEISFGIPMWNPYPLDGDGCPILPKQGGPSTTFTPANDTNLTQGVSGGNTFTYRMFCERPGTYMYHCHVEASEHVHMGMYGPMWIYPKSYGNVLQGGAAYNNPLTSFSQEASMLLSDIDSDWHDSILDLSTATAEPNPFTFTPNPNPPAFNIPDYRPNYWLLNGRSLPDTLMAGKWNQGYQPGLYVNPSASTGTILNSQASSLTFYNSSQPTLFAGAPSNWPAPPAGKNLYPPRQPVQTYVIASVTEKVLIRLHNMGFQYQAMHFHGVMPNIVGKDTFAWVPQFNNMFGTPIDERKRIFTQGVFSGETWDMIGAYPDKAAISPRLYGFINNPSAGPMPYSTSEVGVTPLPTPNADYGDGVHVLDPSIPMILGPGAIDPATGNPTPGPGLPSSSGIGTATGYAKTGYPLFYLWHVHDDYRVTNNGEYPGGAVAVVKILKQGSTTPTPSIVKNFIPI
jgi:manganese oxidase